MQDRLITRLWHTNIKCFIEQFSILQTINSEGKYEHTYFKYNSKTQQLERLSTCYIEEVQSIGLKDKNDKLICEGDIVKNNRTNQKYKIIFIEEAATFMFRNIRTDSLISTYQIFEDYKNDLEVIGNIYENPELM